MYKLLVGLLFMATIAQGKERIQIVSNGKSNFSIYTKTDDSLSIIAADVIFKYTKVSTKVELPIINSNSNSNKIVLEKVKISNEYPEDSYSLSVSNGNLILKGSGRGILYAAYRYVRDVIGGKKWYVGEENTFIPKRENLFVNIDYKVIAKPSFNYREVYFPTELDQTYMDWYGLHNLEEKWGLWGHSFFKILPPSEYFKEHPEYYSLFNGVRQPLQLCLSNEEVLNHTISYFKDKIAENPDAEFWSISPNDDIGHCTCDQCIAIDDKEGGHQGSLIHFVNKVATHFPKNKFTVLAYLQTANAPKLTKAADNVYVILSNIDAYKINDIGTEQSAQTFRRQLRDWKAKSKHVYVWDYLTQYTAYLAPFPIQGTLQKSLSFLKAQGTEGVFLQGPGATLGDMTELNAYVLSHLVWDTNLSEEQLTNEFLEGYYGKASPWVKKYLIERRKNLSNKPSSLSIYGNPIDNRHDFLSPEAIDQYSTLLDQAEKEVDGNPLLENRIRRIGLGLDYTTLQQARFYGPHKHGVFEKSDNKWVVRPQIKRKLDQFIRDGKNLGVTELTEGGLNPDQYAQEWTKIFDEGVRINKATDAKVSIVNPFDENFPSNGINTLIDSVPGYLDYSYNWLLWYGKTADATLTLDKSSDIQTIEVNFLQDARHWIFPPKEVKISVSSDGKNFEELLVKKIDSLDEDYTIQKIPYKVSVNKNIIAVHVEAIPFDNLPEWRYHPRKKVMIACDEIWLN